MEVFIERRVDIPFNENHRLASHPPVSIKPQQRPQRSEDHANSINVAAVDTANFSSQDGKPKLQRPRVIREITIEAEEKDGRRGFGTSGSSSGNYSANELMNVCYAKMWRGSINNSLSLDGDVQNDQGHEIHSRMTTRDSSSLRLYQNDLDKLRKLRRRPRRNSGKCMERSEALKWCEGPEKFLSAIKSIREQRGSVWNPEVIADCRGQSVNKEGLQGNGLRDNNNSERPSVNIEEPMGSNESIVANRYLLANKDKTDISGRKGYKGNGENMKDQNGNLVKNSAEEAQVQARQDGKMEVNGRHMKDNVKEDTGERKGLKRNPEDIANTGEHLCDSGIKDIREHKGKEGDNVDIRGYGRPLVERSGGEACFGEPSSEKNQVHFPAHVLLSIALQNGDHNEGDKIIRKNKLDLNNCQTISQYYLHRTIAKDQFECARVLIGHGIDVNRTNTEGFSPVAVAFRFFNFRMVALLVEAGANIAEYTESRLDEMNKVKRLASSVSKVFEMEL